jgi:hypothetical protein
MKTITLADVRSWRPCYDPAKWLPQGETDWSGTALDILDRKQVPAADRLWAVLRREVLDDATLRLCACAIVRETPLGDGRRVWDLLTDDRSRRVVEVVEQYARGEASDAELAAAGAAAWAAAWAAARAAARAAGAAAWAAEYAAGAAADAAGVAAWAAAGAAAWAAEAADAAGAAESAALQHCADIVRGYFPTLPRKEER